MEVTGSASTRGARPGRGGGGEGHARLVHVGTAVHAVGGRQWLGADDAIETGRDVGREGVLVGNPEDVAVAGVHEGPLVTHVIVGVEAPQSEGVRTVRALEAVDEIELATVTGAQAGTDLRSEWQHVALPEDLRVALDEPRHDHGAGMRIRPAAGLVNPRVMHGGLGEARSREQVDEGADEQTNDGSHDSPLTETPAQTARTSNTSL